jgi:hypothetical protein
MGALDLVQAEMTPLQRILGAGKGQCTTWEMDLASMNL